MKKLALALVASSALVGAAQAEMSSGFYLGAGVGGSSLTVQSKDHVNVLADNNVGGDPIPAYSYIDKDSSGDHNPFGGIFAGYTGFSNCILYGAEIGYTYANDSVTWDKEVGGRHAGAKNQLERKHLWNIALRVGYKLSPSTAAYVRLGLNSGKAKVKQVVVGDTVDAVGGHITGVSSRTTKDSKRITSFAPGFGFETALNRNLLARIEYTYDFGSSFKPKKINKADKSNLKFSKLHRQQVMLGIAYKF